MRLVFDTSVLVAGFRSRTGASRALLNSLGDGSFDFLATPALFLEYESVLKRAAHMEMHGHSSDEISSFLDKLAATTELVRISYRWRPQLMDADDEFVLEAAINGHADAIVTFNTADFLPAASRFGIEVLQPGRIIQERLKR